MRAWMLKKHDNPIFFSADESMCHMQVFLDHYAQAEEVLKEKDELNGTHHSHPESKAAAISEIMNTEPRLTCEMVAIVHGREIERYCIYRSIGGLAEYTIEQIEVEGLGEE